MRNFTFHHKGENVKIKTVHAAAQAGMASTMIADERDRKRVRKTAIPHVMNILLLWSGAVLQLHCKNSTPPGPMAPVQPNPDVSFQGIGDLPGGRFHSEALGISDDGKILIGRSSSARFEEEGFFCAVRDSGLALQVLLGSSGAPVSSEPRALTPNGEIIAGKIVTARGIEAARWTAATGWVSLGDLAGGAFASQALGISIDGAVVVGWGSSNIGLEAARWVNGNALAMGDLSGGGFHSAAALVSADGRTVVGTGNSAQGFQVFRWTESTGMIGLGDLAGGEFSSEPFGMTPDAAIIVGEASSALGIEAFRWTQARGMEALGDLPGGTFHSIAFDVSDAGAIIVGFGTTAQGAEAFIWEATNGMRKMKTVIVAAGLREVESWQLTEATGISADGRIIVGNGLNPGGQNEGWIAKMP